MDASLVFYGKMVALGDMKTGETRELNELKVINIPLSDSREAAALITEDEDRRSTFAFYRDYYMNGYTAFASYLGDRYDFHFYYTHNHMKEGENGGSIIDVTNQTTQTKDWTVPDCTSITMSMSYTSTSSQRRGQITVTKQG